MQKLFAALTRPGQARTLYHFTDSRNLPSIAAHGLLSLRELGRRGIAVAAYGGDIDSRQTDARLGLDDYVHLSLLDQHPMELRARERGGIVEARYVKVAAGVLTGPGVRFCPLVSTTGEPTHPIADVDASIDFEVAFTRTDWNDPAVNRRLQAMRKFEILVPKHIPVPLLQNL